MVPIVVLFLRHVVQRLFEVFYYLLLLSNRLNLLCIQLIYVDRVIFVTTLFKQDFDVVVVLAEHFSLSPRLFSLILFFPLNTFWKRLEGALLALLLVFNVFDELVFNCKLFHIFLRLFLCITFG